jgi:hypothetical protein
MGNESMIFPDLRQPLTFDSLSLLMIEEANPSDLRQRKHALRALGLCLLEVEAAPCPLNRLDDHDRPIVEINI